MGLGLTSGGRIRLWLLIQLVTLIFSGNYLIKCETIHHPLQPPSWCHHCTLETHYVFLYSTLASLYLFIWQPTNSTWCLQSADIHSISNRPRQNVSIFSMEIWLMVTERVYSRLYNILYDCNLTVLSCKMKKSTQNVPPSIVNMLIKGQSIGPYRPINIFKCTFKWQSLRLSTCL